MLTAIKKLSSRKTLMIIIVGTILFVGCQPSGTKPSGPSLSGSSEVLAEETLPADAGSDCQSGPKALTPAMVNSWFESGRASLNGPVKPANSVTFSTIPNCSFYQWTEQMFLWLTSPATGRYGDGGLVMNSPVFYDISLPDSNGNRKFLAHKRGEVRAFNLRTAQKGAHDLPIILEKKSLQMLEILPPVMSPSGKQLILDKNGNEIEINNVKLDQNNRPVLMDVNQKEILSPRAMIRSKNNKSLSAHMPLLDEKTVDKSSLVQKVVIDNKIFLLDLNGTFHEAEQGQADGSVLMAQNGSLVYYSLTVNNVYALYRTMLGATVPAGTQFPTDQGGLNAISAFAVAHGQSPVVDSMALCIEIKCSWVEAAGLPDSEKFVQITAIVPTYDKSNPHDWVPNGTKTVRLAMVGMHVVGSTQGHPEMLWGTFEHVSNDPPAAYSYTTKTGGTGNVPQNTAGKRVFCAAGATGPFNVANMVMGGADGDHIVSKTPTDVIGPSNILRLMPFGMAGSNAISNAEVISTNNIVLSMLDSNDVRKNYIQTGTTWTVGGASPTPDNQVGTNLLANTTMETFFQGGTSNCFNCHSTNTTRVSHVFNRTAPLF